MYYRLQHFLLVHREGTFTAAARSAALTQPALSASIQRLEEELGATLFHLVTGSLPFAGKTSEEVLAKQVLESLSGERIRALEISPQVHYLIEKMMAKEKEIRFQDPEQLAREVDAVLAARRHEEAGADQEPSARRMLRRRRR